MALANIQPPQYLILRPFCETGTKNIIPDENNITLGLASFQVGYPPITQTPVDMGGLPPQRADFNGILYMLSAFAYWQQSGGLYAYKTSLQYAPLCMVAHNTNLFVCLKNNGVDTAAGLKTPGVDTEYWQTLLEYIGSLSKGEIEDIVNEAVDDAKQTLVSSQVKCGMTNVEFTAATAATTISIFASSKFSPNRDGNQGGTNTVTIKVNNNVVGSVSMGWYTNKSGSKGHYWGNTHSASAANSFAFNVKQGDVITATSSGGFLFSDCAIQITLGA